MSTSPGYCGRTTWLSIDLSDYKYFLDLKQKPKHSTVNHLNTYLKLLRSAVK